jgi:hypothetical protein
MSLTSYKLIKLPSDNRGVDQRLADHMKEVKELGEQQAIANRLLEGSLIEYSKQEVAV